MLCGLLFIMPGLLWPTSPLSTFPSTHIHIGFKTPVALVPMGIGHGAETDRLLLVVCVSSRLWLEKQAASAYVLECFSIRTLHTAHYGDPVLTMGGKRKTLPYLSSSPVHISPGLSWVGFSSFHTAGTFPVPSLKFSLWIINLMVKSARLALGTLLRV